MIRLTEEQKILLGCYEGGKTKVIREMQAGIEELKENGGDAEMVDMMEGMVQELKGCSNREYFMVREEVLVDDEDEEFLEE